MRRASSTIPHDHRSVSVDVTLLGAFRVAADGVDLPLSAIGSRLVAVLALRSRPVARPVLSGILWPDLDEPRAAASLRSTLHRLPKVAPLLQVRPDGIALGGLVDVDLRQCTRSAVALLDGPADAVPAGEVAAHVDSLSVDLLPDWDEDWVVGQRERHRQLRLHALEDLSRQLRSAGRWAMALHAGLAALEAEPLRESAHRVVVEAHLAEGNWVEAGRHLDDCRRVFADELGVEPSQDLLNLVPRSRGRSSARTSPTSWAPRSTST